MQTLRKMQYHCGQWTGYVMVDWDFSFELSDVTNVGTLQLNDCWLNTSLKSVIRSAAVNCNCDRGSAGKAQI